jgi:hypothetical protein
VIETIYLFDNHNPWEIYRLVGVFDEEGCFVQCDQFNPQTEEWQLDVLTQYQRDEPGIRSIKEDQDHILEYFGFDASEIVDFAKISWIKNIDGQNK